MKIFGRVGRVMGSILRIKESWNLEHIKIVKVILLKFLKYVFIDFNY